MAIGIIPKSSIEKPSLAANILFYFSIILLAVTATAFFSIKYFIVKNSDKEIESLNQQLEAQKPYLSVQLEFQKKKIDSFGQIIADHQYTSKIFPFLEGITHPKVLFSSFKFDSKNLSVNLTGLTQDFKTLGQQTIIFKKNPLIKKFLLSGVSMGKEGEVSFGITFFLDPQIVK